MEQAKRAEISSELFGVLARIVHRTAQDAATIRRRDGLELERLCHLATQALDQLPDEN